MFAYFEWLLVAFPLAGTCINAFLGRKLGRRAQNWVATVALIGSLFVLIPLGMSQVLRPGLVGHPRAIQWVRVWDGDRYLEGPLALRVDALSVFAAAAISVTGLVLVVYSARHLPAACPRHLALAALDAALAALLLVVLADNLMCLLLGWALSGLCLSGAAWMPEGANLPPVPADRSYQTASPRRTDVVPCMLSLASDLSLLFALGFLASLLPSWTVDMTPTQAQLMPDRAFASRELGAAALFWLLASLIRVARRPAPSRSLDSGSQVADVAVYALFSGFPGVYLIVRGSPLVTVAFAHHSALPLSSQTAALPWWWFGVGSGVAVLGYELVRRFSTASRISGWSARLAGIRESVCSFSRRLNRPLIRARSTLWRPTGAEWVRRAKNTVCKSFLDVAPDDEEPPQVILFFLLLATLLVLAYLLLR